MAVASSKFEGGRVLFPLPAPWLAEFKRELFAFPASRHDDQCDSVSQALNDQDEEPPLRIPDKLLQTLALETNMRLAAEGHRFPPRFPH